MENYEYQEYKKEMENYEYHYCNKCSLVEIVHKNDDLYSIKENKWHHLQRVPTVVCSEGSILNEKEDIDFELCDVCLKGLVDSFALNQKDGYYNEF